ncbi:MAG: HAMP domain-containing histidine kinase, partial [Firmicutes bacterium]|nr:HAMP domain-containing histidine kinase [Bacillota bacterium]
AVTDEKNRMRLDNIRAEGKRMNALAETLLSLATGDSRQLTAEKTSVDFSYMISSVVSMFEPAVFDLNRAIESEIEDGIFVHGDPNQLRRLADILIDNALRYGAEKSPIVVRLSTVNRKEALLSVTSQGTPLSQEDCTRVFERFYRLDASRGQTNGFGLGLSIAMETALRHDGKIWAESDGETLNTFYVKLPVKLSSQTS